MGTLDLVVSEVENKFALSQGSASSLLAGVLGYINEQGSGLKDLLDRFRQIGLGDSVSSWLSGGAKPISPENVENALGSNAIGTIASKAGLSLATTASALAFMLPKIVQRLAPGGAIPARLPSEFTSYLAGPTAAVATGAREAAYAAREVAERNGIRRFWPFLALIALVLVGLWLWSRRTANTAIFNVDEQVRIATQRASDALAALRPGFSSQDLVSALNLSVINFPSGSAEIPRYSYDFLARAAAAIKGVPTGTIIEVGGHTDNTGDSTSNLQLSQQRAEAVRNYLVSQGVEPGALTARGYGDTKPIAANDTEEGKFRNRRIEFRVTDQTSSGT